jgi:hypothetical protein
VRRTETFEKRGGVAGAAHGAVHDHLARPGREHLQDLREQYRDMVVGRCVRLPHVGGW